MSFATTSIRRACTAQASIDTPLGALLLARTAQGLAGAWFDGQGDHPLALGAPVQPGDALLRSVAAQFAEYFAGRRTRFDVPLDLHGTAFQRGVWQALLGIAPGETCCYSDIAQRVGATSAVRAVGAAIGKNPVSVIVPCHRVIGRDGTLTGYAGGLHRKRALLSLEGVGAWFGSGQGCAVEAR